MAKELGAGFQYDITIVPKHSGDVAPLRHRMTDDQLLWFLRQHLGPDNWNLKEYPDDYKFCGIGLNSITIDPYGEIYSCVGARVSAGNVREQPLSSIWRTSPVWQELNQLSLVNLPVCYTCELRQFCIRCHGNAAYEDGDFMGCSSVAYREARMRRQVLMEKGAVNGR
jgi:radical SAM protein with 4Fe4S-binding SPASM domain